MFHLDNNWIQVFFFVALIVAFQAAVAQWSLQTETKRRWQHAITGHALVLVSYVLPLQLCIAALLVGGLGIVYIRLYQKDLYIESFGPLLRPSELQDSVLPGAFWFLCGTLCCICLFPMDTARYAVECLTLADPLASFVGTSIASPKFHASASVAGCLASFSTAVFLGVCCFDLSLPSALAGGLACSVSEAFPLVNDNLSIPIATGAAVVGVNSWLGHESSSLL